MLTRRLTIGSTASAVGMRFADEPTHLWEIPEPSPLEFPVPGGDPALPEPEPVGA